MKISKHEFGIASCDHHFKGVVVEILEVYFKGVAHDIRGPGF